MLWWRLGFSSGESQKFCKSSTFQCAKCCSIDSAHTIVKWLASILIRFSLPCRTPIWENGKKEMSKGKMAYCEPWEFRCVHVFYSTLLCTSILLILPRPLVWPLQSAYQKLVLAGCSILAQLLSTKLLLPPKYSAPCSRTEHQSSQVGLLGVY